MGWKKAAFWTLMCGLKQVAGHRSVHFWKAVRLQVYLQPLVEGDAERCRPSEKQPQGTGTWGLSRRGQHGAGGAGSEKEEEPGAKTKPRNSLCDRQRAPQGLLLSRGLSGHVGMVTWASDGFPVPLLRSV